MAPARQRLAKYVPERYAVNKNRRLLLDNRFGYHGIIHVPMATDMQITTDKYTNHWIKCSVFGSRAVIKEHVTDLQSSRKRVN
jgi:hypothetical protein